MAKRKPNTPPTADAAALARSNALLVQATTEIERLRAENRALKIALALAEDAAIDRMQAEVLAEFDTAPEV